MIIELYGGPADGKIERVPDYAQVVTVSMEILDHTGQVEEMRLYNYAYDMFYDKGSVTGKTRFTYVAP